MASGIVVAVLTLTGAMKFIAYEMEVEAFHRWGYPAWFVIVVGLGELTVAACVLWPRSAFYGGILGVALMLGAITTHLRVPELGLIPVAVPILLLCAFVAWRRRAERWRISRP